jgi:hypothetical protein
LHLLATRINTVGIAYRRDPLHNARFIELQRTHAGDVVTIGGNSHHNYRVRARLEIAREHCVDRDYAIFTCIRRADDSRL